MITCGGSLWRATMRVKGVKPDGEDDEGGLRAWVCVCKRGRDSLKADLRAIEKAVVKEVARVLGAKSVDPRTAAILAEKGMK